MYQHINTTLELDDNRIDILNYVRSDLSKEINIEINKSILKSYKRFLKALNIVIGYYTGSNYIPTSKWPNELTPQFDLIMEILT